MAQIDFLGDPIAQYVDGNGVPLAGGLVWCYAADTDTFKSMYGTITDAINQTNPLTNPVELDSAGRASIVYAGASKFVLENSDINPDTGHGSVVWTANNIGRFGNTVIDPNGDVIVEYGYLSSAVNYFKIINSPTGQDPVIQAIGGDSNIGMTFYSKGTSGVIIKNDTVSYSLPTADGVSGSVFTTDGAGHITLQPPPGISGVFPSGSVIDFAGTSAPAGWLLCDGSAVSRSTNAALFAAIGTTWGVGDGVNTFNIPNCNRRVRMGSGGTGTATIGNAVGNTGGEETHTLTTPEIPSHQHAYTAVLGTNAGASGASFAAYVSTGSVNTGLTGGGGSHNNIQPACIMMAIIKT